MANNVEIEWDTRAWDNAFDELKKTVDTGWSIDFEYTADYASILMQRGYDLFPVDVIDQFKQEITNMVLEDMKAILESGMSSHEVERHFQELAKKVEDDLTLYIKSHGPYKTGELAESIRAHISKNM